MSTEENGYDASYDEQEMAQATEGDQYDDQEMLEEEEEFLEQPGNSPFMQVMALSMPWVISVLFHVGLFLIMLFIVMIAIPEDNSEDVIIPDSQLSDKPGGSMNPSENTPSQQSKATAKSRVRKKTVSVSNNTNRKALNVIAAAGGGGAAGGDPGMNTAGGGGPKSSFMGTGGNAHNIIWVIDRSGSMIDSFDYVRKEMIKSISKLKPVQNFYVILFADGDTEDPGWDNLAQANSTNKRKIGKFLLDVTAEEQTDPIPALKLAFKLFRKRKYKKGKLVYLLTDGLFPDNDAVLKLIAAENKRKDVLINTYLYGQAPKEAVEVMTKIARQTGGRYTFVPNQE